MEITRLVLGVLLFALYVHCSKNRGRAKWTQRLNILTNKKFAQGKSELVFLLDRSGSVGAANFEIEKGFVENLLTNFVVAENATRVAVITYSRTATLHIDYIKNPKNKCFLSEEIQQVTYEGSEQTNTAAALLKAQEVLRTYRKNVNKAIILLSDGISTAGKDPVEVAKILKKKNIEIFTFAIGRFLRFELDSIATDVNHTFNAVNFRKFRKLARQIRGDPHETKWHTSLTTKSCDYLCDNPYAGQAFDPGCCDFNAKCTCGLISGLYNCVCGPGYFGESGLRGDCRACPIGTYKDNFEPTFRCKRCPRRSTTSRIGGSSLADCHCLKGYTGDPGTKKTCKIRKCSPLQSPRKGKIIGKCRRKYKSTCYFSCEVGYRVSKHDSQERTCQADGTWSGETTVCEKIRCSNLETPKNGEKHCTNKVNSFGTECSFKCSTGFILLGSRSTRCGPGGLWSDYQPECLIVTCPVLKQLKYGSITPLSCVQHRTNFSQACFFQCYGGFSLIGPNYMLCNTQGAWESTFRNKLSHKPPLCKDVESPRITCNPSIQVKTKPGADFAWVEWNAPEVWDNSGLTPKLRSNPNYRKTKAKFKIGKHTITYKATDSSLLTSVCKVHITIIDREPPRVIFCPDSFSVNTTELEEPIFWKEPVFEDNSKSSLKIFSTYRPGKKFQVGKWSIPYVATDASGNDAICEFSITVAKNTCPYHPPPVNGALTCSDWLRGEFCQVYCRRRFEFAEKPAKWYICGRESVWKTMPANGPIPWPDCSEWHIPKAMRKLVGHYFTGNCLNKRVQQSIKERFLIYFKKKFDTSKYCKGDKSCKVSSVKIKCGKENTTIARLRGKRDTQTQQIEDFMEIEVQFTVEADSKDSQDKSVIESLVSAAYELLPAGELQNKDFRRKIDSDDSKPLKVTAAKTLLVCGKGQVKKGDECVNCPVGTYLVKGSKSCKICPVGQYQSSEAQLECLKCPKGTWTVGNHNRNFTECKDICQEGTYSKTGLETCSACTRGTYQDAKGQSQCIVCPKHTTTWMVQASNSSFCQGKCRPGGFSDTGLQPCLACPAGYYQDRYGQQHCTECPKNLSTKRKGSSSRTLCTTVDHCKANACKNGGTCHNSQHSFSCSCTKGFHGHQCDNEADECLSTPCEHNSTCIDKVADFECVCSKGFIGKTCDAEINECLTFPCQNGGTCMDKLAGYECFCLNGYAGSRCEIDLDLCAGNPCGNHGKCSDLGQSFKCECDAGFEGELCENNLNDCASVICLNDGSCKDGINSYSCVCSAGYSGKNCEINVDDCQNNGCQNDAKCIDMINKYHCKCKPGFSGVKCENELPANFMATFTEAKLSNYAMWAGMQTLNEFTIDAWMQSKFYEKQSGTILSYAAVHPNSTMLDNALTLTDPSSLKIFINNRPIYTGLEMDDGQWHRLTVSWTSLMEGAWSVAVDGRKFMEGKHISQKQPIPGGGVLIMGQEQDTVGGNFNILESFLGNLSNVNIWNKVIRPQDIKNDCQKSQIENLVMAWPDFTEEIHGDILITKDICPRLH